MIASASRNRRLWSAPSSAVSVLVITVSAWGFDHPRDHGHEHRCDPAPGSGLPATHEEPCDECPSTASPVVVANGDLILHFDDLTFNLPHLDPSIRRTYNSIDSRSGAFGTGWASNMELRAIPVTDGQTHSILIRWPSGHRHKFVQQPDGSYAGPLGNNLVLRRNPNGTLTLNEPGRDEIYEFDSNGGLIQMHDRNGNAMNFGYDPSTGCLEEVELFGGRSIEFSKGPNGKIASVMDWAGRTISYEYSANGNLTAYVDPLGNRWTYTYDAANRLTGAFDPLNRQTVSVTYDAQGRVSRLIDRDGDYTYSYPSAGTSQKLNNEDGGVWTYKYDSRGVITTIIDPLGGVERRCYDPEYNLSTEINQLGHGTQYTHNDDGQVTEVRQKASMLPGSPTPFSDNVEQGTANWTTQAPWGTTNATAHSGSTSWTDSPGGNYANNANTALRLANAIDLTAASDATLLFWTQHNLASGDLGRVEVSINNGSTWSQIAQYSGVRGAWYQQSLSLTSVAGRSVLVRFRLTSNSSGVADGWYIDDVSISAAYPCSPEAAEPTDIVTTYTYNSLHEIDTITDPMGVLTKYEYDVRGNRTRMIEAFGDPLQRESQYVYDADGNLTQETAPLGHTKSFTYDAAGLLGQQSDPRSVVTTFAYDVLGNRLAMTEAVGTPLQRTTTYTYDALSRLLRTTFADGSSTSAEYDAAGSQAAVIDENGNRTEFGYDQHDRLMGQQDALGTTQTFVYNARGDLLSQTDARGATTTYAYDLAGRRRMVTDALGNSTTFEFDPAGNPISEADALARVTFFEYDAFDRLIRTVYADATTIQSEFDARDHLTADVDARGGRTEYAYDNLGRRISVTNALGCVTTFLYDAADRVVRQTDALGHATVYTYDAAGNLLSITDPLGNATVNTYDEFNRLRSSTDAEGNTSSYAYDAKGRLVQVIRPDGTFEQIEYDGVGNVTAHIDADGYRAQWQFDALRRETRQTLPTTAEITKTYDANGLTTISGANGNVTSYAYDLLNRLVTRTDPLGKSHTYQYDAVGNLIRTTDRIGRAIDYAYDSRNRRTTETWDNGHQFTFTFDANGNMLSGVDSVSSVTFTYDALNRILSESNAGTPGAPEFAVTYVHDCLNVTTVSDSLGAVTTRQYDSASRLTQLAQAGTAVYKTITMGYDTNGRITTLNRNNASLPVSTFTYDRLGRLTTLTHGAVAAYTYVRDGRGNITQTTDAEGVHRYTYDSVSQLLFADHPDAGSQPDETYVYDLSHNRTSSHLHGSNYQIGAGNRLLADGTLMYSYDDNGNLLAQVQSATGDELRFQYDHRDRLRAVDRLVPGAPESTSSFGYDAINRRSVKASGGTASRYAYDGGYPSVEFANDGSASRRFMFGPDHFDRVLLEERGDDSLYLLWDHLGSITDELHFDEATNKHFVYDSFGRLLAGNRDEAFGFAGKWLDTETGTYFLDVRLYDPRLGRAFQEATFSVYAAGTNLYAYGAPVPPETLFDRGGGGKTWCDLASGGMQTIVTNAACDRTCTREHEADHRAYRGPCCRSANARYKACGDQACRNKVTGDCNSWVRSTSNFSECRAYRVGRACRDALLSANSCNTCPANPKGKAEQERKRCCGEIKSGISRDDRNIASRCPGADSPRPF